MGRRRSVLLVNGFPDGREMYADYLDAHDLDVIEAAQPEAALRQAQQANPDVVVTDVVFPGTSIDGLAFIRRLREHLDSATSIIVVSGDTREEDREKARQAGADVYLLEPTLPSELLYEIRRALILRRSGRRLSWN